MRNIKIFIQDCLLGFSFFIYLSEKSHYFPYPYQDAKIRKNESLQIQWHTDDLENSIVEKENSASEVGPPNTANCYETKISTCKLDSCS